MKTMYFKALAICLLAGILSYVGVVHSKELFPLTDFYDTPESFASTGKPGDLIRSMEFDGYSQGGLVVSSGVVLVPQGEAPEGGWPVIAWAHGTSGVNRTCAPSLTAENFANPWVGPNTYLERGYAVVAVDYAGLGSDSPIAYMDRIANAWDVINSVKAAQKAVPSLDRRWIATGHSAGAHAMRGVAELQAEINDPSYLGIVSLSGLGNGRDPMVFISRMAPQLAFFICISVKARYPDFDYTDVLTDKGLELFEQVKARCQGPGFGRPRPSPIKGSEALKKDWDLNPYIDKYFKMDESGQERYRGPALVLIGDNETPHTMKNDPAVAKSMCQQGVDVLLKIIPDARHGTLFGKSMKDQMKWIADRFAGKEIPSNCETAYR
jgi:acetyl esterase/lipase